MHLQSLELFGFKSFADKTVFNFHEGITAVVGPNGCGKSNVCDAVRWVLGEQSAKSLRGGEMADVIFNGTDSRKPLGFAEVSLTFTDCGQEFGVDWHDIRVTRRIYRDGNSDYFLNKTMCRLKDIHALFADTGIGRSAYSIMEQGKIDLILSSHPEDRRSVFEEAAGITKYKTQKKEALRKLEATEANLLRIGDIIKEVKRQIGSLQRQAGKARRYQALHGDLQVLETHFSHSKLRKLETELTECANEIGSLVKLEQDSRRYIDQREERLGALRVSLAAADERIAAARMAMQRLEAEMQSHRNRIEFNEQRAVELRELIQRSKSEIGSAESKLREHESEIAAANALVEQTAKSLEQQNLKLRDLTAAAADLRRTRAHVQEQIATAQLNLSKDEVRLAACFNDLKHVREQREATKQNAEALQAKIAELQIMRDELQARLSAAQAANDSEQQTVDQLLARVRSHESDLTAQQERLAEIVKKLALLDRAIGEKESRHDALRQLNEEGEGLAKGSQALLKNRDFEFAGALAAQLDIAPEFVPAIEAALGRNVHTIILRDGRRAAEVLRHLQSHNLGQAALALEDMGHGAAPVKAELPAGSIGWAIEHVKTPEPLGALLARLLANVALFQTLEAALPCMGSGIAAATLDGEFISHEGVIFGGKGSADSLLQRKSRIEILAGELAKLRGQQSEIEERRKATEAQIASTAAALEEARTLHRNAHLAHTASASKTTDLQVEQNATQRNWEIFSADHATLQRQIAAADVRIAEIEAEGVGLEQRVSAGHEELARLALKHADIGRREEEVTAQSAKLQVAIATDQQKHQSLLEQRAPMLARQGELKELIESRTADIASFESRLQNQAAENEAARVNIEQHTQRRRELQAETTQLNGERSRQLADIHSEETNLREDRRRLSEVQEKRGRCSVRQTQLQLQIEHLVEHITERYRIDLRQFAPDIDAHEKVLRAQLKQRPDRTEGAVAASADVQELDAAEVEKLIADLWRQLDNMGPVNLEAVQEYDELEERHKFLETQNSDLTSSKRELLDVIARINATTQKLFADTFAQVRNNFREMFIELFGGGRADLQLLDENDALNCGIDIIAKPPGKQLQNISLLSGGERTMTAVALLFAIYMVRPSPFCLLDEMDAPLDESNINRFIKVLERFADQSQFIIITHNKRTIAKADILYGVTMEERGVSKLVGVKLTAPARQSAEGNGSAAIKEEQQHWRAGQSEPAANFAAR